MATPAPQSARLQLDLVRYQLLAGDRPVHLERQPMELLILLAKRRGELVSREDIAAQLWSSDIFVGADQSINRAICKLRLALHDDPEHPKFLETVVGKGYRFIGDIQITGSPRERFQGPTFESDEPGRAPALGATHKGGSSVDSDAAHVTPAIAPPPRRARTRRAAAVWFVGCTMALLLIVVGAVVWQRAHGLSERFLGRPDPGTIRSLAVLPLENLSGDPAQQYFADGVTDELTTELAQVPALRVISRVSAMQYRAKRKSAPEIASELHVDALVEGSVVRSGDHVRITAQLFEAKDDRHLWAQSFEGELKDLVVMQDEVAGKIAGQIRLRLPPREGPQSIRARTINPEAHDLYMRGIALRDNNDDISLRKSIYWFRLALEKDPDYAPAHAGLAVAYTFQSYLGVLPSQETFPKAEEEARKAVALDASLGKAHDALAWVAYVYRWDWPLVEKELRRALELNPNDVDAHHYYSHYLFSMGHAREALAEGEVAAGLDPLSQIQKNHLLWQYAEAKDYDRAIEIGEKIVEAGATDPTQYMLLADAYAGKGRFEDAIVLVQRGIALSPTRTEPQAALANTYAQVGKTKEAWKILRQLENPPPGRYVSPMGIAVIYCTLGEKDHALEWLEKAIEQRDASMGDLSTLPGLETLHADPRFRDLVRRVGLPMNAV